MNLCITLVIYQESLHDARSTKYEIFNNSCFAPQQFFLERTFIRKLAELFNVRACCVTVTYHSALRN